MDPIGTLSRLIHWFIFDKNFRTVLLDNKDKKKVSLPKSSVVKKTTGVVVPPPSRHLQHGGAPHSAAVVGAPHTNTSSGPGRPSPHDTAANNSHHHHVPYSNSRGPPPYQQLKCHSSKSSSTHDIVKRPIRYSRWSVYPCNGTGIFTRLDTFLLLTFFCCSCGASRCFLLLDSGYGIYYELHSLSDSRIVKLKKTWVIKWYGYPVMLKQLTSIQ